MTETPEKPQRGPLPRRSRAHKLTLFLNEEERDILFAYRDQEHITQADVIRQGLKLLARKLKRGDD